ncbi:MAG: class I SAM-dependent methyltransferase, partial [Chloroflexi bacterium]|nr:class I SAM-dependent methyltransferase [Chloroflexota bacterium]
MTTTISVSASQPASRAELMNLESLDFLISPRGQALVAELREQTLNDKNLLATLTRLRARYTPEQAAAAVELTHLRRKAQAKFSRADAMFFTREALEQASGEVIASRRAQRYADFASVLDLGCGIGGDTVQLARRADVTAIEQDAVRLRMAQLNVSAYGVAERVHWEQGDFARMSLPPAEALFLDPARRSATGTRVFSIHQYTPPLTLLPRLLSHTSNAGVKISPGVDYA